MFCKLNKAKWWLACCIWRLGKDQLVLWQLPLAAGWLEHWDGVPNSELWELRCVPPTRMTELTLDSSAEGSTQQFSCVCCFVISKVLLGTAPCSESAYSCTCMCEGNCEQTDLPSQWWKQPNKMRILNSFETPLLLIWHTDCSVFIVSDLNEIKDLVSIKTWGFPY